MIGPRVGTGCLILWLERDALVHELELFAGSSILNEYPLGTFCWSLALLIG